MSDIKELTDLIVEFRHARDWEKFHNIKDLALSLVLESSEVLELFQWKSEMEVKELLNNNNNNKLADELADVLYWVLLMAHDAGIDLKDAVYKKMIENKQKYPVEKSKGNHKKYNELN